MTRAPEIELRINLDPETLLGPGKAALLQAIDETGSIAAAGRRLEMSYKRAWYLIDTMNTYFSEPVVVSAKGGNSRGGARLTATGRKVLDSYRRMEKKARSAIARDLANLAGLAAQKEP
ncbi:MAG: winged helix-turn-helix domain-containing protein [Bradyrhizobium sp.]|nr:winged helix-turn-helix domain-containing protein [Bradyrhizobium sp.]MDE2331386.1 winged helix-turn-helix domain-containing protein [Bradyrhizobium sp.]